MIKRILGLIILVASIGYGSYMTTSYILHGIGAHYERRGYERGKRMMKIENEWFRLELNKYRRAVWERDIMIDILQAKQQAKPHAAK